MKQCMEMNGGGPFHLYAGQVTDDSELAMCLLHGLIDEGVPEGVEKTSQPTLYVDNIAKYYRSWYMSEPFDIGQSTTYAFKPLVRNCKAAKAYKNSLKRNTSSLSNGSLMRCTPMAVFTSALSHEDAK